MMRLALKDSILAILANPSINRNILWVLQAFSFSASIVPMEGILSWLQIIFSIILIIIILLQKSEAGIGSAFGAGNDGGVTFHKKRGFEKFIFHMTIVIAALLVASLIIPIALA